MLDDIDIELLVQCSENPGQSLKQVIAPLLKCRKIRTLYDRMASLEEDGLIEIRRQKKMALVKITEKGKAAIIIEKEKSATQKEALSPSAAGKTRGPAASRHTPETSSHGTGTMGGDADDCMG